MAIRYLIAPNKNQRRDSFGGVLGPVSGLVTQGYDPTFNPIPIRLEYGSASTNTEVTKLMNFSDSYLKVIGGRFDGVVVNLASTPESFNSQTGQSTSSESPIGSQQPVISFGSTGERTMSFSFQVFGDYIPPLPDIFGGLYPTTIQYCKFLQQIALPTHEGAVITPPIVELVYAGISILGIYKCDVTFGTSITNREIDRATISISITETEKIIDGMVNI